MQAAIRWMLVGALLLSLDATAAGVDVRLVIDVSGSMKSGDPEYLRQDVLERPRRNAAGGQPCRRVDIRRGRPMWWFAHGPIDDAWRRSARAARSTIGTRSRCAPISTMRWTKAAWDVADASPDYSRHIVLVSDGRVDVADDASSNDAQRRAILDNLAASAARRRHTCRLSRAVGESGHAVPEADR